MIDHDSWILRHWRAVKILGLALVALFFFYLAAASLWNTIEPFVTVVPLIVFVGWQVYYMGSAAEFFFQLIDSSETSFEVDWWRFKITFGKHHIMYFFSISPYSMWLILRNFIPREEIPPEHFQVWRPTSFPINTSVSPIGIRKHLLRTSVLPILFGGVKKSEKPTNLVAEDLTSYFPENMPEIPSFKYMGVANIQRCNILIALLSKEACVEDFFHIFDLLDEVEGNIHNDL